MGNLRRVATLVVSLLLAIGCGGESVREDGGPGRIDAGIDAGPMGVDAGSRDGGTDAGRDAGPTQPDSGPVQMGTFVHGGLGTLGGSPSGGRYRVVDDHFEYGGISCGGAYCVFGGAAPGHGLTGAP